MEVISDLILDIPSNKKDNFFRVLSILKEEYKNKLNKNSIATGKDFHDNDNELISSFKNIIDELDKKLKQLNYGTRGYILVYTAAKDILNIDVHRIKIDMEKKYSKNKACNLLRSLSLAGEGYLKKVFDLACVINSSPEEYIHYLSDDKGDINPDDTINISDKASSIITKSMVEESLGWSKNFPDPFYDDEIPF